MKHIMAHHQNRPEAGLLIPLSMVDVSPPDPAPQYYGHASISPFIPSSAS
nr:hypothetical protein [Chlorobium sp.]